MSEKKNSFFAVRCRREFLAGMGNFLLGFILAWILWLQTMSYIFSNITLR